MLVAAIISAIGVLNLAGSVARSVSCEIKQINGGGCALAAAPVPAGSGLGQANPSTAGGGGLGGGAQMDRVLGSNRLIDACAGGLRP